MLKVKALAGKDMIYTFPGNFHRNEERLKASPRVKFSQRIPITFAERFGSIQQRYRDISGWGCQIEMRRLY